MGHSSAGDKPVIECPPPFIYILYTKYSGLTRMKYPGLTQFPAIKNQQSKFKNYILR